MLFSNGLHRGSHYKPSRSSTRPPSCGALVGPPGVGPTSSSGRRRDVAQPNATTIVTVRDKTNPKRTKTIITLRRRQPSDQPAGVPPGAPHEPLSRPPSGCLHKPVISQQQQQQQRRKAAKSADTVASMAKKASTSWSQRVESHTGEDKNATALAQPDSPTSTLLSGWKEGALQRNASHHSFESAQIDGSEDSCDTAMTQVDDGLSDWGLPKVIDYYGVPDLDQGQEQEQDDNNLESQYEVLVPQHGSMLKASAFPYDEPAVEASFDYPTPSAAQIRLQQFLVLMYVALLLKKRGIVPPRFGRGKRGLATSSLLPTRKPHVLRILPFASWL